MRMNERTELNKIIEDLNNVRNSIDKEIEDDYNYFDTTDDDGLMCLGEFVDDEMIKLEEIIHRLSELSNK